jgi:molybdopterin/thiamine biosynthesis adenylyltransferase
MESLGPVEPDDCPSQRVMNEQQWRQQRDDRTLRYAERRLDPERWIVITSDPEYLQRYEGQVAMLTATNLLGRMSPSVALSFGDTEVHARLPWAGRSLADVVLSAMRAADPYGRFCLRGARPTDHRLHLGRSGDASVAHGLGWNAFCGPGPSPLLDDPYENPIGAALAALLAVSQIFVQDFSRQTRATTMNALSWEDRLAGEVAPEMPAHLGTLFFAGVGSVGSAALYFLALSGREFKPTLVDMDVVKVHNLDRSPIFLDEDVGRLKVRAAERFLRDIRITPVAVDERPLHESPVWTERSIGSPDVLIAAANEMNVRYHIETRYPPVQLYGTTGRNWQASVIRHIPLSEACSCCLFPPDVPQPAMACATASSNPASSQNVDAALPFLSFAAGLMTAAEVMKLGMPGYPFSANRVTLNTRPDARLVPARIPRRPACICEERSAKVHRRMIEGSRYAFLTN